LRIYRENGTAAVDITDRALRVVYSRRVDAVSKGEAATPGFGPNNASVYVIGDEHNKRPVWARMGDGVVQWGYEDWWPSLFHTSGTLYVVAKV
ncbi:hypothetical protein, partial [Pseudomonas aeruginosa]